MSVKIARLKSGEDVIADIKEVSAKDDPNKNAVAFQFTNPYTVILEDSEELEMEMWGMGDDDEEEFEEELLPENEEESKNPTLILYPWCPLARNRDFYLRIEEVVTVYDPHTQVTDKYDQLLKDKKNGTKTSPT
tara:strand:+ start:98 stop:499 length:402 start_codon:yes stop_codon:yes gene_type:complete